ncbi:MAG: hypothetical protein PHU25_03010 [Deltaproteobacteria bacterium]|nr:hypothetical protein [Deltaproteobacteria bacterium]
MKPMIGCRLLVAIAALAVACSGAKNEPPKTGQAEGADASKKAEKKTVVTAEDRIKAWLGDELSAKVKTLGSELGAQVGGNLAGSEKITDGARKLGKAVFKDKDVAARLDKVAGKATEGLGAKLKLGWLALQAGGIDEYKKQVGDRTQEIASDVLAKYLRDKVLKDKRMTDLIQRFVPLLKLQAKVAAVSVEQNLSPRAAKKILGIAIRVAAAGSSDEAAAAVEGWITQCDPKVSGEVEALLRGIAGLKSVDDAISGLAVEILGHETTKRELAVMVRNIIDDKDAYKAMIKAYEAAAFDKGEDEVRKRVNAIVELKVVDRELFAALDRLASAPGAQALMAKHVSKVGEDPELAALLETFIVNLLDACGDPTAPPAAKPAASAK